MWSYSVLLWELATREVPFADMSPMEIGMKVSENIATMLGIVAHVMCFVPLIILIKM